MAGEFPFGRARWIGGRNSAAALVAVCLLWGWAGAAAGQDSLRLDQFQQTFAPNKTIPGWDSSKFAPVFGSGDKFFFQFVHKSPTDYYLHLQSGTNNSFSVGSQQEIQLSQWPVLEWEWRVTKTPQGGDVRVKERDDQGGSVCVVLDPGLTSFDSSLCYLFENDGPKDQPLTSQKSDKAKYLILRTAQADTLGQWYRERREIYQDYKKVFGREPTKKGVVGVQIDSNDTKSSAEAFYRNFVLRKK